MKEQIKQVISTSVQKEVYEWLEDTCSNLHDSSVLYRAFAQVPGKIKQAAPRSYSLADGNPATVQDAKPISSWSADRLCRVYLLATYTHTNAEAYHKVIEQLFTAADVNELVALYTALPLLAYPESWAKRCAEGIRSNIGSVLEAIMYFNTYPAAYLEQPAWNQMILKAFFTDKNLSFITGLQERNNRELALTLMDYVHERRAAGRTLNPMIWLLIGQFAESSFKNDFSIVLSGNDAAAKSRLQEGLALSGYSSEPLQGFAAHI